MLRIFIMTDLEGVAGVGDSENYCWETGKYYQYSRELLTGEVNAAVRGFFAGGADAVHVQIGHNSDSIELARLDERVTLTAGNSTPVWPWGLDAGFDALAFVGQHAKAGSSYAHLAHTGNKRTLDQRVNGLSIGEYGALALCAMELGIPTIFAAGDEALTLEAAALTPGVVTVAGKRGIAPDNHESDGLNFQQYCHRNLSACHRHPAVVRRELEAGAKRAAETWLSSPETFHYPELRKPYYMVREHRPDPDDKDNPEAFAIAAETDSIIAGMNAIYDDATPRIPLNQVKI